MNQEREFVDCTLILYRNGYSELERHWISCDQTMESPMEGVRIVKIVAGD